MIVLLHPWKIFASNIWKSSLPPLMSISSLLLHQESFWIFHPASSLLQVCSSFARSYISDHLLLGFSISSDDIDVDQNGLAACINRQETFPITKMSGSPINMNDLLTTDQIPTLTGGLDVHRRLSQIGADTVDFN